MADGIEETAVSVVRTKAVLDDPAAMRRADPSAVVDAVAALPAQVEDGWRISRTIELPWPAPRAVALLAQMADLPIPASRRAVVDEVLTVAGARVPVRPNVDLALGALSYLAGLPAAAIETTVALARCAGWLAHAIEEQAEAPLRFRALGRYVGERDRDR